MTHTELLTAWRRVVNDPNAKASDFDFYINDVLPTFLRKMAKFKLYNSHLEYIPKFLLALSTDKWQYKWLENSKYTSASINAASGVIAITDAKSTYFLAPGDKAVYDGTEYIILAVDDTGITLDSSVTATGKTLYVYPQLLMATDAYILEGGGQAGIDEIPVTMTGTIQAPQQQYQYIRGMKYNNPKFRLKGDILEISWNPDGGDYLHVFYVPKPLVFDYQNTLLTALDNPTQLSQEANQALCWYAGISYWVNKGDEKRIAFCQSRVDDILGTAGISKGMVEW